MFSDPYACMIFQRERMEDIGEAQNFRVKMAQYKCSEAEAREIARKETFDRVCIFGLGTTGMFIGDLIHQRYPDAKVVGHRDLSPDTNYNGIVDPWERIKECPCFEVIEEFES